MRSRQPPLWVQLTEGQGCLYKRTRCPFCPFFYLPREWRASRSCENVGESVACFEITCHCIPSLGPSPKQPPSHPQSLLTRSDHDWSTLMVLGYRSGETSPSNPNGTVIPIHLVMPSQSFTEKNTIREMCWLTHSNHTKLFSPNQFPCETTGFYTCFHRSHQYCHWRLGLNWFLPALRGYLQLTYLSAVIQVWPGQSPLHNRIPCQT